MKTLAIISQKGGVGKTTLATALAVAAEKTGRAAAVFDLDPQASAAFWHDTREADSPAVIATPAARRSLTSTRRPRRPSGTTPGKPTVRRSSQHRQRGSATC
jgi:cellulose biosynthesis protein BcsQ